jgi:pyruvate dehydrogenase E1 component alpha subunit/2-oxoisovalerate dehydrogenase E1 component alpha subunit
MARKPAAEDPPRAVQLEMWRFLRLARALDERAHVLHKQGKVVGGLFSNLGQEAISVGAAFALEKGDYLGPMIRNLAAVLVRGHSAREVMAQYLARAASPTRGKDNSQHFGDVDRTGVVAYISMLGIQVSVLGGMALGAKLKGEPRVALTFIGDGATSVGDFYEGLNFAAVQKVPLIVIIENNGYGYSTPTSKQSLLEDLADKAAAFGIPGHVGDGNDVLEVYRLVKGCVEEARSGLGPRLVELKTFRMRGHAPHDGAEYVPKELFEKWRKKDPIARFEKHLKPTAKELQDLEARVRAEVDDAADFAERGPLPDGAEAVKGVFADDSIVAFEPWWRRHA